MPEQLNLALVDRVYEAAVDTTRWPDVLQEIADRVGAIGAMYLSRTPTDVDWVASPKLHSHIDDYVAEGWAPDTSRAGPLFVNLHPGFQTEEDLRSLDEIAELPVNAQFWIPRGFVTGAGTIIQGAVDEALQVTFEGFASHGTARAAVPFLDELRPHIGRALSLAARLQASRTLWMVETLELAGLPAAVIRADGALHAANARFEQRFGNLMIEHLSRLRFIDRATDARFAALLRSSTTTSAACSLPISGESGAEPLVIHFLPLAGFARSIFDTRGFLLIGAGGGNVSIPGADLLRVLFDLTPAEARVARMLMQGHMLGDVAAGLGIKSSTARVHIRSIFGKTATGRQVDLIRKLGKLAPPLVAE